MQKINLTPKKKKQPKKQIGLRLDEHIVKDAKQIAQKNSLSFTEIVNRSLKILISEYKETV